MGGNQCVVTLQSCSHSHLALHFTTAFVGIITIVWLGVHALLLQHHSVRGLMKALRMVCAALQKHNKRTVPRNSCACLGKSGTLSSLTTLSDMMKVLPVGPANMHQQLRSTTSILVLPCLAANM